MNEVPIRILLVGEALDACRLRGLLDTENSTQFHITHVTDLELAAERLASEAADLYNRRGFMALAEQHLRVIQRKGAALLIYVDLDDLKVINDTHGHLEGNRALIVTANVLRACFRQSIFWPAWAAMNFAF